MKIIRFENEDGRICYGVPEGEQKARLIEGELFGGFGVAERSAQVKKLLYPLEAASILGIGANYRQLFEGKPLPEYPIVFHKGVNSLQHPGDPIVLPRKVIKAEEVKYEGELAVVIGKEGKNISESDAMDYVFGYTIANDVSGTDWQQERVGMQWSKGKSFDTFCPMGPVLVTKDEIPDPRQLRIVTRIDGKVEQDEKVESLCFPIPELIAFLSAGQTLRAGDVILTGSPKGARFLKPGEVTAIAIEGIGTLENPCVEEEC